MNSQNSNTSDFYLWPLCDVGNVYGSLLNCLLNVIGLLTFTPWFTKSAQSISINGGA